MGDPRLCDGSWPQVCGAGGWLADRVIVLSRSPAVVRDMVGVELSRPRTQLETKGAPEFVALRKRVFELVAGVEGE